MDKPRIVLLDDRSEFAEPLLGTAREEGWQATLALDAKGLMEACDPGLPEAIFVRFGSGQGPEHLRAATSLGDGGNGSPAVVLMAPHEVAADLREIAPALGLWDVVVERNGEADPQEVRRALRRLVAGEGPAPSDLSDAIQRLAGVRGEASLGSRRLEAVKWVAEMAARQFPFEEFAPLLLNWALPLTGSTKGWVSMRSLTTPGELRTITEPAGLDREALSLALSLIQETAGLDAEELRGEESLWASLGFGRILVCPLTQGTSGWIGVADAPDRYGPGERLFLEALAAILALHSRNAIALHQAKSATEESKALFKAATLILPYEEPEVVARQVAQTVASVLGYRHCAVLVPSPDGHHLTLAGASGALERIKASFSIEGLGLTVQAYRTGRMVYCPSTAQSPMYIQGWPECRSELAIPLIHRNEVLGVLDLQSEREQAYQGKDLRVVEAFAQRVGTLLYAARQYQSLAANKERYQSLCDGAPMGLFTWNMTTGRIEQASAVLESWAGEDIEGKLVEAILAPASRDVWKTWAAQPDGGRNPLSAPVQVGGTEEIPPVDCHLTAYPGRGALHLPGHAVLLARLESPSPPDDVRSARPSAGGTPVLLADPDPVWSSVTRIMLEEWGYPVESYPEPAELGQAIERAAREPEGLLVVDSSMVEARGGELIQPWLRCQPPKPLLVLGGAPDRAVPHPRALRLAKPYRMRELRDAFEELLRS